MAQTHVDGSVLSGLRDVMEDEYPTLLGLFIQDSEERLAALHRLSSALAISPLTAESRPADLHALGMTAHSFKGSSSNMGAPQLAELCRQLEDLARSTADDMSRQMNDLILGIEHEYQQVRQLFAAERQDYLTQH